MTELPAFLTVQEYADLLRVSKWSVYDAVNAGQIKAIRVGKSVRIPRSAIAASIDDPERGSE